MFVCSLDAWYRSGGYGANKLIKELIKTFPRVHCLKYIPSSNHLVHCCFWGFYRKFKLLSNCSCYWTVSWLLKSITQFQLLNNLRQYWFSTRLLKWRHKDWNKLDYLILLKLISQIALPLWTNLPSLANEFSQTIFLTKQ